MPNPRPAAAEVAVFKAIENRNLKAYRKAITRGCLDVAALRCRDGTTALQLAMQCRADEIALAVLDEGVPVSPAEADLVWAVLVRRPDIVRRFIDLGADVNARTIMGTALSIAAAPPKSMLPGSPDDLLAILRLLLDNGADPNAGSAGGSPLSKAVEKNATAAAMFLIDAGARIDDAENLARSARDNGNAPLANAIRAAAKQPRKSAAKPPPAKKTAVGSTPDPLVATLEKLCRSKAFPFEGIAGAFSLHVDSRTKFDLAKAQPDFLKRGRFLFALDPKATRVALLPTTDKYAAITAIGTNGDNHGLSTADIILWLRNLEKTQPFTLTGIGRDFLQGRFTRQVKRPAELARAMYDFCPDIFEQGVDTVEAMERDLQTRRDLFFWWD